jgi:hypothetical protein
VVLAAVVRKMLLLELVRQVRDTTVAMVAVMAVTVAAAQVR